MIKRALGIFRAPTKDDSDSDDSEEVMTVAERTRLERRLLPGSKGSLESGQLKKTKRKLLQEQVVVPKQEDENLESEEEENEHNKDEDEEEEDVEGESDDELAVPPVEEKPFRGKYRCELCPNKIILNEQALEVHMLSAQHIKNEKRFDHAKAIGLRAYKEECRKRLEARTRSALHSSAGGMSKKKLKNFEHWKVKRDKQRHKKAIKPKTSEELEAAKLRFQRRKAKRKARDAEVVEAEKVKTTEGKRLRLKSGKEGGAESLLATVAEMPKRPNRKDRRAAKFGDTAAKSGGPSERVDREGKRKRKHEV